MKRDLADFHIVLDANLAIHARLGNWSRYVSTGRTSWQGPIWKLGKSNGRQWHEPVLSIPVDSIDGHKLEKGVADLPAGHRDALRWAYCFRFIQPFKIQRELGVTEQGLMLLIEHGRTMLRNRGV